VAPSHTLRLGSYGARGNQFGPSHIMAMIVRQDTAAAATPRSTVSAAAAVAPCRRRSPHGTQPPRQREDPLRVSGPIGFQAAAQGARLASEAQGGASVAISNNNNNNIIMKSKGILGTLNLRARARDPWGGGSRHRPPSSQTRKLPPTQHQG